MNKVDVYYSVRNAGDGSVYLRYFLSAAAAEADQEPEAMYDEPWGEPCWGTIGTYEGSQVHAEAVRYEAKIMRLKEDRDE